jgi:hypothetical protein
MEARMTFTDFHPTRSELPRPRFVPAIERALFSNLYDDPPEPEDTHWEDFGTASSLAPWGWR